MFALVAPGRPASVVASRLDVSIRPLLAAVSAGIPLGPAMRFVVHRFGFDSFMYGQLTEPRPQRDSRSLLWTTHPRE